MNGAAARRQRARRPLGVFDSGVGGLSVLRALRAALPHERFVYLADSANAPYGERDPAWVRARALALAQQLCAQHRIKALVVACNTATAAAIAALRAQHPGLPLVGLEPALKPAIAHTQTGHVGVIATRTTLASAKFAALCTALAGSARIVLQPCDGLAQAIERSAALPGAPHAATADADTTGALCRRYLQAMGAFGNGPGQIDTLVLGCTHYVFASDALRALLGPAVQIMETGAPVARQTLRLLTAADLLAAPDVAGQSAAPAPAASDTLLLTTGAPAQLQAAAQRWLNLPAACCASVCVR